ncbi:MAG TPA: ATP-binding protein [Burkholderiales bacterium]|nr:ATP-binding protein [Burkholderiales bacterium]
MSAKMFGPAPLKPGRPNAYGAGQHASVAQGIRARVLLLLAAALSLLTLVFFWMFVRDADHRRAEDIARAASTLELMVEAKSAETVGVMRSLSSLIMSDPRLAQGLRTRNRDVLFRLAEPILRKVRAENGITHFYFILPDRTMLLRVQQPADWGDRIDRQVLQKAQRTGEPAWGNEQGPFGTLTLRVVHPWRVGGELIGYFELGVEFEDVMKSVVGQLDMDVFVAADKRLFDRQKFESAKKVSSHQAFWDEFPSTLVLSRTGPIPPPVAAYFRGLRGAYEKKALEVAWNGHVSQAIMVPFTGIGGGMLGQTVVLRDITAGVADSRRAVASVVAAAVLVGAALLVFFYVFLGRIQRLVVQRTERLVETERKLEQEQAELIRLNAELEQRVTERTTELVAANRELRDALDGLKATQGMLINSEKHAALGRLVAGVAHELNTPIGNSLLAASTFAERCERFARDADAGLRRSTLDAYVADSREAAQILQRNLEKAGNLISSFKQVAADQTSSQRRAFLLNELIDEVLLAHRPVLRKMSVVAESDVPAGIRLDSYPGPLGQVLGNLIVNAVQHGYDGYEQGSISVSARLLEPNRVELAVRDRGRGISEQNLKRVFDPFFTTRLGSGGTGLGLSICHSLVTQVLGGEISVESTLGAGTSVIIRIPRTAVSGAIQEAA